MAVSTEKFIDLGIPDYDPEHIIRIVTPRSELIRAGKKHEARRIRFGYIDDRGKNFDPAFVSANKFSCQSFVLPQLHPTATMYVPAEYCTHTANGDPCLVFLVMGPHFTGTTYDYYTYRFAEIPLPKEEEPRGPRPGEPD